MTVFRLMHVLHGSGTIVRHSSHQPNSRFGFFGGPALIRRTVDRETFKRLAMSVAVRLVRCNSSFALLMVARLNIPVISPICGVVESSFWPASVPLVRMGLSLEIFLQLNLQNLSKTINFFRRSSGTYSFNTFSEPVSDYITHIRKVR